MDFERELALCSSRASAIMLGDSLVAAFVGCVTQVHILRYFEACSVKFDSGPQLFFNAVIDGAITFEPRSVLEPAPSARAESKRSPYFIGLPTYSFPSGDVVQNLHETSRRADEIILHPTRPINSIALREVERLPDVDCTVLAVVVRLELPQFRTDLGTIFDRFRRVGFGC